MDYLSLVGAGDTALNPLYQAISTIGPYAIGVVLLLGILYAIIVGVKFAKAEDAQTRGNIQKALINGIIGFLIVVVLIIIVYAIREPLTRFMDS